MDTIRKLASLGLGLIDITEEKARELADELIKRGEARSEKPGQLVKDILARGEEMRKNLQRHVEAAVEKAMAKAGVAGTKEIAGLRSRIEALEKKTGTGG